MSITKARKDFMLSEVDAIDELLNIYTANNRDRALPVKVILGEKQMKKLPGAILNTDSDFWTYRGWLLDRADPA